MIDVLQMAPKAAVVLDSATNSKVAFGSCAGAGDEPTASDEVLANAGRHSLTGDIGVGRGDHNIRTGDANDVRNDHVKGVDSDAACIAADRAQLLVNDYHYPAKGRVIVWLGCPETANGWPLMTRSAIAELPLTAGPPVVQTAMALDRRKSAVMVLPPAVRLTSATEASERARSAWPMVVAWATSAVSTPGKLIDSSEVCRAPPEGGSGPVSYTGVVVWG